MICFLKNDVSPSFQTQAKMCVQSALLQSFWLLFGIFKCIIFIKQFYLKKSWKSQWDELLFSTKTEMIARLPIFQYFIFYFLEERKKEGKEKKGKERELIYL